MKFPFNWFQILALALWVGAIYLFDQSPHWTRDWFMSVTMLFGSLMAGATSEGGGAVAFPVMTLFFNISPKVARDFSLLIQSFGMTAALFTILKSKIPIAKSFLLKCLPGAIIGQIIAFLFLEGVFSPTFLKISFTSIWLSFALVLYFAQKKEFKNQDILHSTSLWPILIFSFLGGIITALTGSGVDILTFSLAILYFHISEKIATPTSVVLMAINSMAGIFIKGLFIGGIEAKAYEYWLVCLPVVIIGAPFGAIFIFQKSKQFLIRLLQVSIVLQFIFSWIILDLNWKLKLWSIALILVGFSCYTFLYRSGGARGNEQSN